MHWFVRNKRVYLGPIDNTHLLSIQSDPLLKNCGYACLADKAKVEIYLTLPVESVERKQLESIRMGRIFQ